MGGGMGREGGVSRRWWTGRYSGLQRAFRKSAWISARGGRRAHPTQDPGAGSWPHPSLSTLEGTADKGQTICLASGLCSWSGAMSKQSMKTQSQSQSNQFSPNTQDAGLTSPVLPFYTDPGIKTLTSSLIRVAQRRDICQGALAYWSKNTESLLGVVYDKWDNSQKWPGALPEKGTVKVLKLLVGINLCLWKVTKISIG